MAEQDRTPTEGPTTPAPAPETVSGPPTSARPTQPSDDGTRFGSAGAPAGGGPFAPAPGFDPTAAPPNAWAAPGYAPPQAAPGSVGGIFPPGTDDFAILSLIIAVGGMATGMGMATSPVAIVLGFMSLSRIRRTGARGREMAIAGILIGFLLLAVFVLVIILSIVYVFVSLDMYRDVYTSRY